MKDPLVFCSPQYPSMMKDSVFANYKSIFSRQFAVSLAVEFLGVMFFQIIGGWPWGLGKRGKLCGDYVYIYMLCINEVYYIVISMLYYIRLDLTLLCCSYSII